MKNKIALALCVHHKPWLLMSTLVSLALQDFRDYDLYVLYQLGDGSCPEKKSYVEYARLAAEEGKNVQLSPFDERVRSVIQKFGFSNVWEMEFENDHALDSGAWYKFLKSGQWKEYDYCFFVQEGTVFTRPNIISSVLEFSARHNVHFLSSGHEKRKVSKDFLMDCNKRENQFGKLDSFHDERIREVFEIFCRDADFRDLFSRWEAKFDVVTQNHVPFYFDSFKERLSWSLKGLRPWERLIYVNRRPQYLKDAVNQFYINKGVVFHRDNGLEWFGCSCQHFLSREFLQDLTKRLEANNIYEVLDTPFSGTPLEVIWGFLPLWLEYDKWFFDGIHRVRKHFVTYSREDDPRGMCKYINRYFKGQVYVEPNGDYINIKRLGKRHRQTRELLPDFFGN